LAQSKDIEEEVFNARVAEMVERDVPISSVVAALDGTDWRYAIENCGRKISLARRQSLSWYRELVNHAAMHVGGLWAIDSGSVSTRTLLRQLGAREQAGRACHNISLEGTRLGRYLKPVDAAPDASEDIARLLRPTGLHWDGGYEVEKWPGENEFFHRRVAESLTRRTPELTA
jgi:hypothetical protein